MEKLRKLFLDEIPYSQKDYEAVYQIRITEASYNEYLNQFPISGAKQRGLEAATHYLYHSMQRGHIQEYEIYNIEDTVSFQIQLVSNEKILVMIETD